MNFSDIKKKKLQYNEEQKKLEIARELNRETLLDAGRVADRLWNKEKVVIQNVIDQINIDLDSPNNLFLRPPPHRMETIESFIQEQHQHQQHRYLLMSEEIRNESYPAFTIRLRDEIPNSGIYVQIKIPEMYIYQIPLHNAFTSANLYRISEKGEKQLYNADKEYWENLLENFVNRAYDYAYRDKSKPRRKS